MIHSKSVRIFLLMSLFSTNLNPKPIDPNNLIFESANIDQREFLVDFAITSNDIYQTRIVSKEVAQNVLDISEETFTGGIVEVVKHNDEVVGFYTLKPPLESKNREPGHLFMKAGLQNRGLGSVLFEHAIMCSKSSGAERLWWISDPNAQDFYLKKGARIVGYEENLLNPKVPLPVFEYDV